MISLKIWFCTTRRTKSLFIGVLKLFLIGILQRSMSQLPSRCGSAFIFFGFFLFADRHDITQATSMSHLRPVQTANSNL